MKICSKCGTNKPKSEFSKNLAKRDGLQGHCKECRQKYQKQWYRENTKYQQERVKANAIRIDKWIWDYLADHSCVDCGETDPVVLEFDHRHPKTKLFTLSNAGKSVGSLPKVKAEVAKCDVRCANCHRRRTAKMYGWYNRLTK